MLARSNFEVQFQPEQQLSERVLFPATPAQRNGIEDARLVCFQQDDGTHVYYATFTAFDGDVVLPELVETFDFLRFRFTTLNGPAAQNKGMALFPRRINGLFAMLSRQDNENMYLMFSDNIHFWNECKLLLKPTFPWELWIPTPEISRLSAVLCRRSSPSASSAENLFGTTRTCQLPFALMRRVNSPAAVGHSEPLCQKQQP